MTVWHKKFISVALCSPAFWFQTVWARQVDGRWEYKKTDEQKDLEQFMSEW